MSTPVAPVVQAPPAAPVKLTFVQSLEADLANLFQQAAAAAKKVEEAVANLHAVQGAIQVTRHIIEKAKAEAATVEAEAKKIGSEVVTEVEKIAQDVEAEAVTVVDEVKAEAKKVL